MLLSAYGSGVFPWFNEGEPVLWWNPDPRCVIRPEKIHVSKRMRRRIKSAEFHVESDSCFEEVIRNCANIKRRHEDGTWINEEMIDAYCALHKLGYAHSIEVFQGEELAGGLYGISLGRCFFGESMFSKTADASKTALISLARASIDIGIELIDCQLTTDHLLSLGAEEISRDSYLAELESLLKYPDKRGIWNIFQ